MSGYYNKTKEAIEEMKEESKLLKKLKEIRKKNLIDYYIRENKSWEAMKKRELALINYDRKPYMNESDWRHDNIWFLCIQSQMTLQEKHYNALENLYDVKLEDLI